MSKFLLFTMLSVLLIFTTVGAEMRIETSTGNQDSNMKKYVHVKPADSIRSIVGHPAFKGFGECLLPWDNNRNNYNMPLSRIETLLPYHNHVNPEEVADSLNRLIDDADKGRTVFYSFYTDEERKNDSRKERTGLFFYRGEPGAPFAVICPGGGFAYVGSLHEGFPYAHEISKKGYNAFVLKYRTGSGQLAIEDLIVALSYIFKYAGELKVGTKGYSIWGSSAGARMASYIGSNAGTFRLKAIPKPCMIVMAYTGQSEFTTHDSPTFSIIGENDGIANPSTVENRYAALKQAGIDVEFHKYRNLGHGFGLGTGTTAEGWQNHAITFWQKQMTPKTK